MNKKFLFQKLEIEKQNLLKKLSESFFKILLLIEKERKKEKKKKIKLKQKSFQFKKKFY